MSGSRNWVVVWIDVHYGQEFESDERSQEAALAEDGVTIGQEEIERYYHARPTPP